MSLLAPYVPMMFKGVRPAWKKILLSEKLKPLLDKCLKELETDLLSKGVTKDLIQQNGIHEYIRPSPEHIFEAFKYFDPHNLRALLLGQDPFPSKVDAHGLSFSSRAAKIPASTINIFKCLHKGGFVNDPQHAELVSWAQQGILLLNYYLTRTPNIIDGRVEGSGGSDAKNMHPFWSEFTNGLLNYLSTTFVSKIINNRDRTIFIMLWGNKADVARHYIKFDPSARCKIKVLGWGHPSPLNRVNGDASDASSFINCDHFTQISREYSMINWDPNFKTLENLNDQFWSYRVSRASGAHADASGIAQEVISKAIFVYDDETTTKENLTIKEHLQTLRIQQEKRAQVPLPTATTSVISVYVDGGCRGNHIANNANAIGGAGVWFSPTWKDVKTASGEISISKKLEPFLLMYDKTKQTIVQSEQSRVCTNQRAELFAVVLALQKILELNYTGVVNIITDSKQYVMSWLGGRLWKEYKKDPKFGAIPNNDLVILVCRFWWMLAKLTKPTCTFIESKFLLDTGTITVIHVNSHTIDGANRVKQGGHEYELLVGNQNADRLCNEALDLQK